MSTMTEGRMGRNPFQKPPAQETASAEPRLHGVRSPLEAEVGLDAPRAYLETETQDAAAEVEAGRGSALGNLVVAALAIPVRAASLGLKSYLVVRYLLSGDK